VCVLASMFGIGVDKRLIVRRDGIWSAVYVHGCVSLSNVGNHASTYTANFFLDGTSSLVSWSLAYTTPKLLRIFGSRENPHDMSFPHCPIATPWKAIERNSVVWTASVKRREIRAVNAAWFSPPEVAD
jgi:hypothetical protein